MAALEPEITSITFSDYFRLDPDTQTLTTDCKVFHLRSKLWQLFIHLINNPDKLVTREQLIHDIWLGNHYTGEKGLTHAVCHLRKVLKTGNIPARIITVPKKGYMLTNSVAANQASASIASPRPILVNAEQAEPVKKFHAGYPVS
ncbi:hypothetical protein FLL45_13875 [Aliikangiella marina]|uniref:OmpR/PhoB-type domain-containing protein n=2 Tax=Aliikangiella marina TaxID=1712262 RepID=A0A545TA95_9GAMM|nr:hypothetical protein FLL45_13875 [Aliikangiella marina]